MANCECHNQMAIQSIDPFGDLHGLPFATLKTFRFRSPDVILIYFVVNII